MEKRMDFTEYLDRESRITEIVTDLEDIKKTLVVFADHHFDLHQNTHDDLEESIHEMHKLQKKLKTIELAAYLNHKTYSAL